MDAPQALRAAHGRSSFPALRVNGQVNGMRYAVVVHLDSMATTTDDIRFAEAIAVRAVNKIGAHYA